MTGKNGPGNNVTYTYDPENRLTEANTPSGLTRFTYDASGNRIKRTTPIAETSFLIDPNMSFAQVIEENSGSSVIQYIHGYDLLARITSGATRWYAYDGLGSTRGLTDSNGTLTDEYVYEGFGSVIKRTGSSINDFLFTGEQFESELKGYYLRARYYEPYTGRFVSRDIFAAMLQGSAYKYCSNDPVNNVDPSGYMTLVELCTSMTAGAILARAGIGFAIGFLVSLADSLLGGADIRQAVSDALLPGVITAGIFAFLPSKMIQRILVVTGFTGMEDSMQAVNAAKTPGQKLLRAAIWIVGYLGILKSIQGTVRGNNPVQFVFRKDTRATEEIMIEGFQPRGNNKNLMKSVFDYTPGDSAYVSTSKDFWSAYNFRKVSNGKVYVIRLSKKYPTYDVNEIFGSAHKYARQNEIAVLGGIDPTDVLGWFENGKFVKNPFYAD